MAAGTAGSSGLLRRWWEHRGALAISLGVTVVFLIVYYALLIGERRDPGGNILTRFELSTLDTRFLVRSRLKHPQPDTRIIIVDIDQKAQEVLGRWPFSRVNFAKMLDALRADGARVVSFDVTFSKPDEGVRPLKELRARLAQRAKEDEPIDPRVDAELLRLEKEFNADQQFADAIKRYGHVVLGNFFLYSQADLQGVDEATLDRYANLLAFFPFPQARVSHSAEGAKSFLNLIQIFDDLGVLPRGAQANIEPLTDALGHDRGSTGFFNIFPDPDGVVRRSTLALPYGRSKDRADWDLYASMDVQTIRYYLDLSNEKIFLNFGAAGIESFEFGSSINLIPDDVGRVMRKSVV